MILSLLHLIGRRSFLIFERCAKGLQLCILLACLIFGLCPRLSWSSALASTGDGSLVGHSDESGFAVFSSDVAHVSVSVRGMLPLSLAFSSDPSRFGGLGVGWRIPLLESTLVEKSSYRLMWVMPSGQERSFQKHGDAYLSQNYKYSCTNSGTGRWTIESKLSGERYSYKDGALVRYFSAETGLVSFNVDRNGRNNGINRSLSVLSGSGGRFSRFKGTDLDLTVRYSKANAVMDYQGFEVYAGQEKRFGVEYLVPGGDASRVKMVISYAGGVTDYIIWNVETGTIVEDNAYTYSYIRNKGKRLVSVYLKGLRRDGHVMSWRYNYQTGEEEIINGERRSENKLIQSPGLTHNYLREQRVTVGSELIKYQKYSYGKSGELLRVTDAVGELIPLISAGFDLDRSRQAQVTSDGVGREVKDLKDLTSMTYEWKSMDGINIK